MKVDLMIQSLATGREVIRSLVSGAAVEQARWKPSPKQWSMLEVINHLADEEREDFKLRLDILLHRPKEAWPPLAPEEWVVERTYNARDPDESLSRFLAERESSLEWLRGLGGVDWTRVRKHPELGPLRAGDFMASWVAHDYLHVRQLAGLHHAYLGRLCTPFSTDYAGRW